MLIQIILSLCIGILFGTITGLTPGIHINFIGTILVSLSATSLFGVNPIYLSVLIVAMAITHTFVDFIPSIFLGCPDTDTDLSVLPGHDLLKSGEGYQAVMLTAYGGIFAVLIFMLITYPSILVFPKIYEATRKIIPLILILILALLIFLEKRKALKAFFVVLMTGALGLCVLNLETLKEPLLPLLSGLFGSSMLILSIKQKTKIPKQKISEPNTKLFKPLLASTIASPLCGFLPALGSGQAAIIGSAVSKTDKKGFLVLLGATNTFVMGFSFLTLYLISKTRSGAAYAVNELIGKISNEVLIIFLSVIFLSGIISFFLTKHLAKFFSGNIHRIDYSRLSIITLIILTAVVFLVSGFFGLIVLTASTFTGIYCISLGVKRTNMMGCLLIPTIIIYLVL